MSSLHTLKHHVETAEGHRTAGQRMMDYRTGTRWFFRAVLVFAVGAGLEIGTLWLCGELLEKRVGLGPTAFDTAILNWVRDHYDPPVHDSMQQITALGSRTILTMVVVLVVIGMVLARYYHAAALVALSSMGAGILNYISKTLIERPRPLKDLRLDLWVGDTPSFPSGHSMASMSVYLTLGVLLSRLPPNRRTAVFTLAASVGLSLVIGFSRVYLRVHYPTDVLAGWTAGSVWAFVTSLALRTIDPSGHWVEVQEPET